MIPPTRIAYSRRQATLEAIRRHFRDRGGAPSLRELGNAIDASPAHVSRLLRALAATGELTFEPGRARSIVLADRLACYSDAELVLACRARGLLEAGGDRLPHHA